MTHRFSETQLRRLKELSAEGENQDGLANCEDCDGASFQEIEKKLVRHVRGRLQEFGERIRRPRLCRLECRLAELLADQGFVQVSTPIIMSRNSLVKMGIDSDHPLNSQVFWINEKQCLRPMLAPHLYTVVKDLLRLWGEPVRLFEIGPCFRKESQGAKHSNEFTMLNLAEFGLPESTREDRIRELADLVLKDAGLEDYRYITERSEVYGDTIDVVSGPEDLEIASSAMGPHPLDRHWRITTTWVGIGFGLERLIMAGDKSAGMGKVARSLTYLDGIRLNI